ncbi:MAG: hypothetical protein D3916_10255 [Candidatus Electrothrix sp. MAN1_4]|nr:hypothetical protein [Candidatus Electrothrix sp. MAN1_4]
MFFISSNIKSTPLFLGGININDHLTLLGERTKYEFFLLSMSSDAFLRNLRNGWKFGRYGLMLNKYQLSGMSGAHSNNRSEQKRQERTQYIKTLIFS